MGGAVRDELLGRPVFDLDVACRDPERAARALIARGGDGVFPLSEQFGALARRARPQPDGRLRAAPGRLDRGRPRAPRLHDQRDRRPARRTASRSIRSTAAATSSVGCFASSPTASSTTTRCACCGRCGFEDELGFRLDAASEALVRAKAGLVTTAAGRADPRGAPRLSPAGYRAARRARPARAARRAARPAPARVRLAVVPPRGHVRREPEAAADPGRPAPLRVGRCCAPSRRRTTRRARSTASAARPSPSRSRRSPTSARRTSPARSRVRASTSRQSRSCAATSSAFRPARRSAGCSSSIAEERAAGTISTREEALELVRRSLE